MMLPEPKGALASLDQTFIDRLKAILTGVGFNVADQISKPLTFTWNSDAPPRVKTALPATQRPLALVLLALTSTALPGEVISGSALRWSWDGGYVTLISIEGAPSSTDFEVTVLVVV